jgi:hypothetical protein
MKRIAWRAAAMVIFGGALGSPAVAVDDVCADRGLQSDIIEDTKPLGFQLLDGTTNFLTEFQAYLDRNKGKELDIACALRRLDPQDVRVGPSPDGKPIWTVDTWRVGVNESVGELAQVERNHDDPQSTIGNIKNRYNRVSPESKDIFIADFTRTCLRFGVLFAARKDSNGDILIIKR